MTKPTQKKGTQPPKTEPTAAAKAQWQKHRGGRGAEVASKGTRRPAGV